MTRREEILRDLNQQINRVRELDSDLSHNLQAVISGTVVLTEMQLRNVLAVANRAIELLEVHPQT